MEVILLEIIENLGGIGDRVNVKSGYGRNYLLPQGKATMATAENVARFEAMRVELEKKAGDELVAAKARGRELEGLTLDITAKAGPEGKLFGSIGPIDITEACHEAGFEVERSEVRMTDGPIRTVGTHEVELHLHAEVSVPVTVNAIGEGGVAVVAKAAEAATGSAQTDAETPAADNASE